MTTAVLTPALKLDPNTRPQRRHASRFTQPAIAPGLPSQGMPLLTIPVPAQATRRRLQSVLPLLRDVVLATLVTFVFLSPFLYFVAPPFTGKWTLGVGLGVVAVTIAARRRPRE